MYIVSSDVDPDPDSESGSSGIKWREKQSLTNIFFFSQEIIFFKSEPNKVANL